MRRTVGLPAPLPGLPMRACRSGGAREQCGDWRVGMARQACCSTGGSRLRGGRLQRCAPHAHGSGLTAQHGRRRLTGAFVDCQGCALQVLLERPNRSSNHKGELTGEAGASASPQHLQVLMVCVWQVGGRCHAVLYHLQRMPAHRGPHRAAELAACSEARPQPGTTPHVPGKPRLPASPSRSAGADPAGPAA